MKKKTVADIVKQLKRNQNNGAKCAMLIGAGCSVEAKIPTAAQIVREVVQDKCKDYDELHDQLSYAECMMGLDPVDRHKILADYIDNAEINRAHIAIAQLMKNKLVDRVLTTNFDPLVVQACALVNEFPAVYDLATSTKFAPGLVRDKAVFHLHGQRNGFFQYHDDEQFKGLSHVLRALFADTNTNRTWIVVGYSGDNDPVFEQLAELYNFERNLYWVTYQHKEPSSQVEERLGSQGKAAFWVPADDADTFLYQLALEMGCLPPELFGFPFSHLKKVMERIGDLPMGGSEDAKIPWIKDAHDMIDQAIATIENKKAPAEQLEHKKPTASGKAPKAGKTTQVQAAKKKAAGDTGTHAYTLSDAWADFGAGDFEGVVAKSKDAPNHTELTEPVAWAHVRLGIELAAKAKNAAGSEEDALFEQASAKYAAALAIKPDMHEALNNWGNALGEQARQKTGAAADALFEQACTKYDAALAIKPDYPAALNNWGNALLAQARQKTGAVADALLEQACTKYAAALAIKPDYPAALNNWGSAFGDQARQKTGADADALFAEAGKKYAAALASKPDFHEALNNWGNALLAQARQKTGAAADALFEQACTKYDAALAIKPDYPAALNNWGSALGDQARQKTGAAADALLEQACTKYDAALAIKPDMHEALNNWGNALGDQARQKTGADADALFAEAGKKYAAALAIKPDYPAALNNWGNALGDQARQKTGAAADALFEQACTKYDAALAIKPDDPAALNNWGNALGDQARQKTGAAADALFEQACTKYDAALAIKPDDPKALNGWGATLGDQARQKTGAAADALFEQACTKYDAALAIKPDMHEALNGWGATLGAQAQQKTGAEKQALLVEAEAKLAKAEELAPGSATYNLACLAAVRGEEEACCEWLEKSWNAGKLPDLNHLNSDEDLDSMRDKPWFKAFLQKVENPALP